jgi:O-antigen/teichoic acid export membrane protein
MPEATGSIALRFFEGALWTTARNLLQIVLSLVALTIVARELGPSTYGLFGVAMLVYGIAEMVCGGAFTDSIVQRKQIDPGHLDATFWLTAALAGLMAGLMVVFSRPLAALAGHADAADIVLTLGALLPLAVAARVPMALLARDLRFKAAAQIGAAATIASCACGIALALKGGGIWTLVAMEALRVLVTLTGAFLAVAWRPGLRGRSRHLRDLWRFNAGVLLTYSIGYADSHLPRLLVSHLLGPQALGIFMLATRVYGELSRLLTEPLHGVAMSTCARLQDAAAAMRRSVVGLYGASRLVVFPVYLGMAAVAPWWLPLLFGERWLSTVPAVQLLMLGGVRAATGAYNSAILLGTGHVAATALLFAAGCAASLLAFPLLAPWGVAGAAAAMLLRQFGTWPLALILVRRATGLRASDQLTGTLPTLAAAAMAAVSIWLLTRALEESMTAIPATIVAISAGSLVYLGMLRLLAPRTFGQVRALLLAVARRDRSQIETLLARPA